MTTLKTMVLAYVWRKKKAQTKSKQKSRDIFFGTTTSKSKVYQKNCCFWESRKLKDLFLNKDEDEKEERRARQRCCATAWTERTNGAEEQIPARQRRAATQPPRPKGTMQKEVGEDDTKEAFKNKSTRCKTKRKSWFSKAY